MVIKCRVKSSAQIGSTVYNLLNQPWLKKKKQLVDQNVKLTGAFFTTQRNEIDGSFLSRP